MECEVAGSNPPSRLGNLARQTRRTRRTRQTRQTLQTRQTRQTRQAWPFPMQNLKYADPVNEVMVMDPTRPSTNVRLMQDPPLTLLMVMYRRLW